MVTGEEKGRIMSVKKVADEIEGLRVEFKKRVIGQEEALKGIVDSYQRHLAGLSNPKKPIGNLLFVGPTGSGKTWAVEALADIFFGNIRSMIRVDCNEFQQEHTVARLIGAPPGYIGYKDKPVFNPEAVKAILSKSANFFIVLFDEIEKAHWKFFDFLLGILDRGVVKIGSNVEVDFTKAMIFMTSNLGSKEIAAAQTSPLGFTFFDPAHVAKSIECLASTAVNKFFRPEFINRLGKVIVFKPLTIAQLGKVLELKLQAVQNAVIQNSVSVDPGFILEFSARVKRFLLEQSRSFEFGARELERTVEKLISTPLASLILTRQIWSGDLIRVDYNEIRKEIEFINAGASIAKFTNRPSKARMAYSNEGE